MSHRTFKTEVLRAFMQEYVRVHRLRGAEAALKKLAGGEWSPGHETIRKFVKNITTEPDHRSKLLYSQLYWQEEFASEKIAAERTRGGPAHTLGARIRAAFGRDGERDAAAAVEEVFTRARAAGELPKGAAELELVMLDVIALAFREEPAYVRGRVRPGKGGPRKRKDEAADDDG